VTTTTVIPALTRWGTSADADLVYRALTMVGPMTEHGLARELGVSRTRVRGAIDELAHRTAVAPACTRPVRGDRPWAAAPLPHVLGVLRYRAAPKSPSDRWRRHYATLDGLDLPELRRVPARWWPSRELTRRRVADLVAAERHEHLTVSPEDVPSAESLAAAAPLDAELIRRGVRIRVLTPPPGDGDLIAPAQSVESVPADTYRQAGDLPLKLMVFDRQVALFPADPLDLEAGYIEIRDGALVRRLCTFFHGLWARGRDPYRQGVTPIELTSREKALVALLAAGHTDVTAAAELQLSARTVAYTMRAMMDRLGVENRFQLALLLGAARAAPLPRSTAAHRGTTSEESER